MSATKGTLPQTVIFPIAALVALAMTVVVALVWYSATTQDRIALEKSIEAVETALHRKHAAIGASATDYGWWNDAVANLDLSLNEEWADTNIGAYQYETYGFELSAVVSRGNRTIFARLDGEAAAIDVFETLPGLEVLVARARDVGPEPEAALGVLPFRDGLAMVAANIVTPYNPAEMEIPEGRVVLVFAKAITQAVLDSIAKPLPFTDLRLLAPETEPETEAASVIESPLGDRLGVLVWQPSQPGREFLRAVAPALVIAITVLAVFTWIVLRHARETTRAVEASEARFRDVADASSDWIWETDPELRLSFLSERFAAVTGTSPQDCLGRPLAELLHPAESPERWEHHRDDLEHRRPFRNVLCLYEDAGGFTRTVRVAGKPIVDDAGRYCGYRGTATDITAEIEAERRAQYLTLHDPLTTLPNRDLLAEHLEQAIANAARRGDMAAVLCLDLDRFKEINDTLGHPTGDLLLQRCAERLAACVRETDTVARIGGDEFAIVQVGFEQPAGAQQLCRRVLETLARPFDLNGQEVLVSASIGIALVPMDGSLPSKLLQNADIALDRAKAEGRNTFRFFEPEMDARLQRRKAIERDLRLALARDELELFYQPRVALDRDALKGAEALVRWRHPERGLVPPNEFISVAEETGLIVPLGEWVLRTACRQAAAWPDLDLSVNISPVQFKQPDLVGVVQSALAESGLAPWRLELEVTESVLIQHTEAASETLHALKALGVRIAMDDFGTGYSSLSYLQRFPFDKIKIDRSFVQTLEQRPDADSIIRAVVSLGRSLHMQTCAEGVETEDQLRILRAEGCDEVQGYYFSKPVPVGDFEALSAAWRRDGLPRPAAQPMAAPA